jgi:hypothetical protein
MYYINIIKFFVSLQKVNINVMDLKTKQKLSKKRRFIIKRLQGLNILPMDITQMNTTQQEIYNNIWSFDIPL